MAHMLLFMLTETRKIGPYDAVPHRKETYHARFDQNTNKRKISFLERAAKRTHHVININPHLFFATRADALVSKKRGILVIYMK